MELTNGKLAYWSDSSLTEEQANKIYGVVQTQRKFGQKIYGIPEEINKEEAEEEEFTDTY
jgi:hypothetical protein